MSRTSTELAEAITKASSIQTYVIARFLVDRDLVDDCYRAYAYFRWADDVIDIAARSRDERIAFIERQKLLVDRLYRGEHPQTLTPEEEILADLIHNERREATGLRSFVKNFIELLEFDAERKGCLINQDELALYSRCLATAVTDGIQYFVGHGHPYPSTEDKYKAVLAAHITHMLRDMVGDIAEGFINIPREYLEAHHISPESFESQAFRDWVQERVQLARRYLFEGKRYLDVLDVLRCKIAGYWYCARYEGVLAAIEKDDYLLRAAYSERRRLSTWIKIAWLGVTVTIRHIIQFLQHSGTKQAADEYPPKMIDSDLEPAGSTKR